MGENIMDDLVYNKRYVGKFETFAFAFSGGGQNFCYALVTNYLMYYYINVFHINPKTVGLMLFIVGIWDIINNPLAGIIIDKTRTKHGKMIPYLRWFMLPLAIFTILLFSGPKFILTNSPDSITKIIYMFVTYIGWELCYTFTDVSYWGLSSALSPNPEDRTRVLTVSNVIINIMAAIPQILVPLFLDYAGIVNNSSFDLSEVFFCMGLFAGIIGVGLFSMSGIFVKERIEQSKDIATLKESILQFIKNPALRIIVSANLLYALSGIGTVFSTYYFIDVLGYASLSIISQIPLAVFGFISYGLIKPIKKRFNNKQIMVVTFLSLGIVQLAIYLLGINNYSNLKIMIPLIMMYQTVLGIFSGFLGVIPNEMIGEATDYSEWKTGKRNEGVGFSLKITTTKVQGTITQSFSAMLLSAIGYITSSGSVRVAQPDSVQKNLWMMFYLIPALITCLCAIPFLFYPLVGEKREKMYIELKKSRKDNN